VWIVSLARAVRDVRAIGTAPIGHWVLPPQNSTDGQCSAIAQPATLLAATRTAMLASKPKKQHTQKLELLSGQSDFTTFMMIV
jgi:hypothetical protein